MRSAQYSVNAHWPVTLALLWIVAPGVDTTAQLGAQQGPECTDAARVDKFASWFGAQPDLLLDFLDDRSWDRISDVGWWTRCWSKAGRKDIVFSVPMLPNDGKGTLAQGAAGSYDDRFRQIAQKLVDAGFEKSIIRLGWEFNAEWHDWAANKDPQSWVAYWQRIVTAMRAVPGAAFRFDWCTNLGTHRINPELVYPGDAYVDFVGMNVYNVSERKRDPQERWRELMHMPNGLAWHRDFARRHNKPMSFPEWGTGTNSYGTGGGDDAYFVTQMAAWIKQNPVAYHIYWDETAGYNAKLSDGHQPRAGEAFLRAFSLKSRRPRAPTDRHVDEPSDSNLPEL